MKKTEIAVIVPVYNAGGKLSKCIKSILNQTFKSFKLILVDDGSTDKSGKICDKFAEKDNRIFVIHQENAGCVKARKTGVFSEEAQNAKYIMFSDADDTMPTDALEILYQAAEANEADLVCGKMSSVWKSVKLPKGYKSPCFDIQKEVVYSGREIIDKLYVGCFGITDFPVNLVAKLYRTELITKASDFEPVVKFMGEDLSVTLRVMPQVKRLVITPKVVYNYRIGGGTSKFMPYMLDDFISLYNYKKTFAEKYPMPYDVEKLMNIEMMNIVSSWLIMCVEKGKFTQEKLHDEVVLICELPIIKNAALSLCEIGENHAVAVAIKENDIAYLEKVTFDYVHATRYKRLLKDILLSI